MRYLTVPEYARKVGKSSSYIRRLLSERRIEGATRMGSRWLIPETARILPPRERARNTGGDVRRKSVMMVVEKTAQVYTFFNHARGAGKTTIARDLGYSLARRGYRVLLIDCDPQANLTSWLGVDKVEDGQTLLRLVEDGGLPEVVEVHDMHLVPANLNLALLEAELRSYPGGDLLLRNAIADVLDRYDVVFVDSPPSLGPLSFVSGMAGDGLIVPLEISDKGVEGFRGVLTMARRYARALRQPDDSFVRMLVPNRFDGRTSADRNTLEAIESLTQIAPVAPRLAYRPAVYKRAMSLQAPVLAAKPDPQAAEEIERLTDFFLERVYAPAEVAE